MPKLKKNNVGVLLNRSVEGCPWRHQGTIEREGLNVALPSALDVK